MSEGPPKRLPDEVIKSALKRLENLDRKVKPETILSLKKISESTEELQNSLFKNNFPRVMFPEIQVPREGYILDEKKLHGNIQELNISLTKIDLPEGKDRLKLQAHNIRSVQTAIENVQHNISGLKLSLEPTVESESPLMKEIIRGIEILKIKYVGLNEAVGHLEQYEKG